MSFFFFRLYNFCTFHAWTKNCNLVSNDEKCIGTKAFARWTTNWKEPLWKGKSTFLQFTVQSGKSIVKYVPPKYKNYNVFDLKPAFKYFALIGVPNSRLIFKSNGWEEEFKKDWVVDALFAIFPHWFLGHVECLLIQWISVRVKATVCWNCLTIILTLTKPALWLRKTLYSRLGHSKTTKI